MASQIRQNFDVASEQAINEQINNELESSYMYQSMGAYFDRDDVALPGFSSLFKHASEEEREHGEKFMSYLNKRGGRVALQDIHKPPKDEWGTGLDALQVALECEKKEPLLRVHKVASQKGDPHLTNYLESDLIDHQVDSIKKLGDSITQLKRAGQGLGEYLFDKHLSS